jgi:hypothetical protein
MEAAVSDGVLTIGEVEALPSLVSGTATTYVEMGQPSPRDPRQLTITGSGTLEDGRAFQINGGGKHLIIDVR